MFLNFKKWIKSIQTAGYNGARTVYIILTLWMKMIKHTYFERMLVWIQLTPTPLQKITTFMLTIL